MGEVRHSRLAAAVLIAVLHAAGVWGLLSLRMRVDVQVRDQPVQVRFIEESAAPRPSPTPDFRPVAAFSLEIAPPDAPLIESALIDRSEPVTVATLIPSEPESRRVSAEQAVPRLISTIEYISEPAPRYPPQSRKMREQGLVVLRVLIDEKGAAASIEVETSSGHQRLDHAACEAVSRAAFRPYVEDGLARPAFVLIPIEFSLNRSAA